MGKGKKMKRENGEEEEGSLEIREGWSPFHIELIRKLIFSHLETKDLLRARLVSKGWVSFTTEEYRGRRTNVPWIGRRGGRGSRSGLLDMAVVLDAFSAVKFLDVMTPSSLLPVQRIALRLDLFCIEPSTFIKLLSFIAPWVKFLQVCPWSSVDVDDASPLEGEKGTKAVAWASAVDDLTGLQFPCLQHLDVGKRHSGFFHPSLATAMMIIVKKLIQGARNLQSLGYQTVLFKRVGDSMGAERQATKILTEALPPTVKRLGFGVNSAVDYEALTTLNLRIEDLFATGKPEEAGAFMKFLDGQKGTLGNACLHDLEGIYGPEFPRLLLLTDLWMINVKANSTLKCLQAFPALCTLRIELEAYNPRDRPPAQAVPTNFALLPANLSVRSLTIRGFHRDNSISFAHIANVLPNLTHVDVTSRDTSFFTQLFTHLPHLQSLRLSFVQLIDYEDMETVLSGIPPAICSLTKDYSISDDTAFDAISVIASRDPSSTVGLANLKDLRVLSISDPSHQYERILTKLFFHAVVRRMPKLQELRLTGEVKKAGDPIFEALGKTPVLVRVFKKLD